MGEDLKLRPDAVEWRAVDGEVLVLAMHTSEYLNVNQTGARVWEALATGTTRAELREMLVEEFRVDETRAEADLDAFLADLRCRGLLDG
jgi:hypothetical protein